MCLWIARVLCIWSVQLVLGVCAVCRSANEAVWMSPCVCYVCISLCANEMLRFLSFLRRNQGTISDKSWSPCFFCWSSSFGQLIAFQSTKLSQWVCTHRHRKDRNHYGRWWIFCPITSVEESNTFRFWFKCFWLVFWNKIQIQQSKNQKN